MFLENYKSRVYSFQNDLFNYNQNMLSCSCSEIIIYQSLQAKKLF